MGQLLANPVDIVQLKFAFEVVYNIIVNVSEPQLNMILLPSQEAMQGLFEKLNNAVSALKTDEEKVRNYFDLVMCIFKRINRDRIVQVSAAFEIAGGLDLLEAFQTESQNEEIAKICREIIKEFFDEVTDETMA